MRVLQRDALHKRNTSCRRVSVCHSCVNIVSKRRKISSIIISHPGSPVIHVVFPHYTNTCEILAGAEACNTGGLRKIARPVSAAPLRISQKRRAVFQRQLSFLLN